MWLPAPAPIHIAARGEYIAGKIGIMPEITVVHFPSAPEAAVEELQDALRMVSDDVQVRAEPPGTFMVFELLLPALAAIVFSAPFLEGVKKKLGELAAEGTIKGFGKAFEALKKAAGHWKKGSGAPGAPVTPLSLEFKVGPGSIRLMFPASLSGDQVRQGLGQVDQVLAVGRVAIEDAVALRRHDHELIAAGEDPDDDSRTGTRYYERVYVYKPELGRWVDVYELIDEEIRKQLG